MEISNDDLILNVAIDGPDDGSPILLLHGITNNRDAWGWLVPRLADSHRMLRLDFRGHGLSGRTPEDYHRPGYVSDAIATLEQLADGPAVVIGHSLGGATAIGLAQARPDLVAALILEDPPLVLPPNLEGNSLRGGFAMLRESAPRMQAGGMPVAKLTEVLAGAPSPTGTPFGELLHDDAVAAMAGAVLEFDASVLDPVLAGTSNADLDVSRPLDMPILLLAADPASPDAVARPDGIERLVGLAPQTEVQVMAGASHLMHDERANREPFADHVLDFLARLDRR